MSCVFNPIYILIIYIYMGLYFRKIPIDGFGSISLGLSLWGMPFYCLPVLVRTSHRPMVDGSIVFFLKPFGESSEKGTAQDGLYRWDLAGPNGPTCTELDWTASSGRCPVSGFCGSHLSSLGSTSPVPNPSVKKQKNSDPSIWRDRRTLYHGTVVSP